MKNINIFSKHCIKVAIYLIENGLNPFGKKGGWRNRTKSNPNNWESYYATVETQSKKIEIDNSENHTKTTELIEMYIKANPIMLKFSKMNLVINALRNCQITRKLLIKDGQYTGIINTEMWARMHAYGNSLKCRDEYGNRIQLNDVKVTTNMNKGEYYKISGTVKYVTSQTVCSLHGRGLKVLEKLTEADILELKPTIHYNWPTQAEINEHILGLI